jgi:hypothetical protein
MARSHGGVVVKTTGSLAGVMDGAEAELTNVYKRYYKE